MSLVILEAKFRFGNNGYGICDSANYHWLQLLMYGEDQSKVEIFPVGQKIGAE